MCCVVLKTSISHSPRDGNLGDFDPNDAVAAHLKFPPILAFSNDDASSRNLLHVNSGKSFQIRYPSKCHPQICIVQNHDSKMINVNLCFN